MIKINNQLISSDIIGKKFICDFERCKGICCIHGDSGAPLENNEIKIIEKIYPKIKPYLRKEGIKVVEQAQYIWSEIEPNWRGVCYKSGMGTWRSRIEWTLLLRKMVLIQRKAEGKQ